MNRSSNSGSTPHDPSRPDFLAKLAGHLKAQALPDRTGTAPTLLVRVLIEGGRPVIQAASLAADEASD